MLEAWQRSHSLQGDKKQNLKSSLENDSLNIQGLIKLYKKPFALYSKDSLDAHEALGIDELKLAEFNEKGQVILK